MFSIIQIKQWKACAVLVLILSAPAYPASAEKSEGGWPERASIVPMTVEGTPNVSVWRNRELILGNREFIHRIRVMSAF